MKNDKTAFITISTGGKVELQVTDQNGLLEQLQAAVDGYVETVPDMYDRLQRVLGTDRPVMLCNDEGLLHGMPRNPVAQAITGYAPLCGPVAIARVIRTETGGEDISGWPISEASRLWRRLFHLAEAM
jgi:hypothetical protein